MNMLFGEKINEESTRDQNILYRSFFPFLSIIFDTNNFNCIFLLKINAWTTYSRYVAINYSNMYVFILIFI